MNWFGVAAIAAGFVCFVVGSQIARKEFSIRTESLLLSVLIVLAIPAVLYGLYYAKILGEPIWLYRWRSVAGSELMAAPAGFLAGWIQVRNIPRLGLSVAGTKLIIPVLLAIGLSLPYLKPVLRPLPAKDLSDQWRDGACIQSTPSTCGPASAATILKHFGTDVSEAQLAKESFTSASGTENWYLARALRRRGMQTTFALSNPLEVSLPAVAGVRLINAENAGHFIALISREGDKLIYNDPMEGFSTNTFADLQRTHAFTGFFLLLQPQQQ